ncbi:MAG: hypothetical protein Q7T11_07715, partial [Deltaproteobacteria bacterium]|nr:hypothetical protein [Deltaproteobacteria bacterium]
MILRFLFLFLLSSSLFAAPTAERVPANDAAPLDLLSSQPVQIEVVSTGDFANRLVIAAVGNGIVIIDTETWALYDPQPTDFSATIGGFALLSDGNTLIVTLSDGNLGEIELDNIEDENEAVADADTDTDTDTDTEDTSD